MATFPPRSAFSDPTTSPEDKLAGFDSVPLFMKSLPSELGGTTEVPSVTREGETNPSDTLAALQALAYEGDPSEIAEGFREQGNALFKKRKFRDAMGFYARALDEVGNQLEVRDRRTLYSNRAACNLELSNFGACLRDCSQVLQQQPSEPIVADHKTTLKALLRSARALLGLDKLPEALDALERLRTLELELNARAPPSNDPSTSTPTPPSGQPVPIDEDVGKKWRDIVLDKLAVKKSKQLEKVEKDRRAREGDESMVRALTARGVVFPKPTPKAPLFHHCPTDVTPPHFEPSSLPPTSLASIPYHAPLTSAASSSSSSEPSASTAPYVPWVAPPPESPVVFPIFLLLPLARPTPTRDLCLEFDERATFGDLVESMDHAPNALDLYFATYRGRVLKVGAKLTLAKVVDMASRPQPGVDARDGWELKAGWAFELVGIPKGDPRGDEWIKEWKEEVRNGTRAIL